MIVGMKEDEVGLNAEGLELSDAGFEIGEEFGDEASVIVDAGSGAREGIEGRLVAIVLVPLGEDAHAQLVERRLAEGGDGLVLESGGLMGPGVAGGAEG